MKEIYKYKNRGVRFNNIYYQEKINRERNLS